MSVESKTFGVPVTCAVVVLIEFVVVVQLTQFGCVTTGYPNETIELLNKIYK